MEHDFKLDERIERLHDCIIDEYGVVYSHDGKKLLLSTNEWLDSYKVRDGVETICDYAFCKKNKRLTSIEFPNTLKIIEFRIREPIPPTSGLFTIQRDSLRKIGRLKQGKKLKKGIGNGASLVFCSYMII